MNSVIVIAVLALAVAAGLYFLYAMQKPLYQPGMVRAGKNLAASLTPPAQSGDAHFWEVEPGVRLYHFSQGQGRNVLVVHGGPGYPYTAAWPGLDPLTHAYRFHYYDQRGCGQSTRPIERFASGNFYQNAKTLNQTLGLGAQVADIERLRHILGEEKLILVGHSFGGFLAALYAAEFPARVAALVLVAPADVLLMPQKDGGLFEQLRRRLPPDMQADYAAYLKGYLDFRNLFSKSEADLAALHQEFARYYAAASGSASVTPEQGRAGGWMVWAMYLSMGRRHDYRAALKNVAAPALVLHGAQDLQTEPASRVYVAALPQARFHVIQDAAHFGFYERPAEFSQVVGEFLKVI